MPDTLNQRGFKPLPILDAPLGPAYACPPLAAESRCAQGPAPLPMSREEMQARGWDEVDVVFVTGDAYVDHPSFAMALLGRVLESEGFRVAILSQPDWRSCDAWRTFGRPRLFFAISAGNMDSMINHYTANRKVRNDDAYSPGGRIGRRPDRATLAYCQRAREAYKGVPVIAGGVEASLRRLAHYDYWSDKVRRSIMLDCQGRSAGLRHGGAARLSRSPAVWRPAKRVRDLRDMRGVAYRMGASESPPTESTITLPSYRGGGGRQMGVRRDDEDHRTTGNQSAQRPPAGAISRSRGRRRQPAGIAAARRPRWTASTGCRTLGGRIRLTARARFPPTRW